MFRGIYYPINRKTHYIAAHPLNSLDLREITGSGRGVEGFLAAPFRSLKQRSSDTRAVLKPLVQG